MSWQQLRVRLPALTLVLLGLLLAAPLSTGDRGLWLSVAPSLALLAEAPVGGLPAEHSTVLPDRLPRASAAADRGAAQDHSAVAVLTAPPRLSQDARSPVLQDRRPVPLQPPLAALAAPRAPPA